MSLLKERQHLLAALLVLFSVVLPITKLALLNMSLLGDTSPATGRAQRLASAVSRYSLVDVLVVALLVVAGTGLPGGTRIELRWGTLAYSAAALTAAAALRVARSQAAAEH